MKYNGYIVLTYGIIVMLSGLIGYLFADSLPSLIMGSVFGALLIAGGLGIARNSIVGYFLSLGCTAILTVTFLWRFSKTAEFFPAGSLALLSGLLLLLLLTSRIKKGSNGS